jgi:hypothetical protein
MVFTEYPVMSHNRGICRELVENFPPDAAPDCYCGKRIFGDKGDSPADLGNEPEANPSRLLIVVPNRFA